MLDVVTLVADRNARVLFPGIFSPVNRINNPVNYSIGAFSGWILRPPNP